MTANVPLPRRRSTRGGARLTARVGTSLAAGLVLAACGPSPVDMVEHPVTTTPSRMAGEELQRSADPEESCAAKPVPTEFAGVGDRGVASEEPGKATVRVPRAPERILALGAGAVDVACGLGLQDLVVGTSGLPFDADVFLPDSLVNLPVIDVESSAAVDAAASARELKPDLIVLAGSAHLDPDVVEALEDVAPTVIYDADILKWTDATEAIADAYGRPRAGGDLLLQVIDVAQSTESAATPSDTQVSLVSVNGDDVILQYPDTLGSLMLEAVNAGRPPAQRTMDGERIPPLPQSPHLGDELDGDVIFAVVGGGPDSEDAARQVFATTRWTDLDAVGARRMFVVDRAVWEGAGPVAAKAVLTDMRKSINGIAPDG